MMPPEQAQQLAEQRQAARRALRSGRHWILRGLVCLVIAILAFVRGGTFYNALGVAMVLLTALSVSLGRTVRRQAQQMLEKIDLMEQTG